MISRYSKEDLAEFEIRAAGGYINMQTDDDLILFDYTDKCTFDRRWDEYTIVSRGLVLNKKTGDVIARPFQKFFNLNEAESTKLESLPLDKGYHVFDKLDGSLGICYFYDGQWRMNTRGSFCSRQAVKGRELLNKYRTRYLDPDFTYLFEIIYPSNKIVVNYGDKEDLILLSAIHTRTGKEINPEVLGYVADQLGMECATIYPYDLKEIIDLQKTLPKDQEGFVVRFSTGFRVKIKGDEYMKIHKMLSHMTPLSFWESMQDGMVNRTYLQALPEEFRHEYEPIVVDLEKNYNQLKLEILKEYNFLPSTDMAEKENRKAISLFMKSNPNMTHKGAMWPMLDKKYGIVDTYIMKRIRPTSNVLRNFE